MASRLKTCVRDEDTVARLGGDEFAILLEQAPSHEVAVRVAGRILEAMRPPFPLQGRHIQIGASVGVTVSDAAMYMAKARGKGRFELASAGSALDRVGTIPETCTSPRDRKLDAAPDHPGTYRLARTPPPQAGPRGTSYALGQEVFFLP